MSGTTSGQRGALLAAAVAEWRREDGASLSASAAAQIEAGEATQTYFIDDSLATSATSVFEVTKTATGSVMVPALTHGEATFWFTVLRTDDGIWKYGGLVTWSTRPNPHANNLPTEGIRRLKGLLGNDADIRLTSEGYDLWVLGERGGAGYAYVIWTPHGAAPRTVLTTEQFLRLRRTPRGPAQPVYPPAGHG